MFIATLSLFVSFLVSLCLTPLLRMAALRTRLFGGAVVIPPVGGVAIVFATLIFLPFFPLSLPSGIWIGALGVALVGFLDDVRPFSPVQKLMFQVVVAALVVGSGLSTNVFGHPGADFVCTVLWLVWMCNAFNVLDMMDGLAAGVGAIAAIGIAGLALVGGGAFVPVFAAALAGGFGGFLVYNRHPARIYMGDTGSLFAGFLLGALAVEISRNVSWPQGAIGPLLVLGVPNFEAIFLCVVRWRKGLPIMQASRDHVAQRMVQAGLTVQGAVGRMYGASFLLILLGFAGFLRLAAIPWMVFVVVLALAVWAGVRLAQIDMEQA
ncbi:MAG: MraY family glycosyltransferase [bacterium]|nr:MraY family glycosyltransferase [bacterium]